MPISFQAPSNLVQAAFDAYSAPAQATILQEDAALKKQELVSNQLQLQNQMSFQQDMAKLWGPGGLAAGAATANDPNADMNSAMPKMLATAQSMFQHNMPQAGAQFLGSLSMMGMRNAETQKYNQQVQWRKFETVGGALGAVTDQASEDLAMSKIRAEGVDPAQYGLTGDFTADGPKLPRLAQMAMTRAQQLQAADRESAQQARQSQWDVQNGFTSMRLDQGQKRLDREQSLADLAAKREARQQKEGDQRDARAQEALDLKKLENEDRSYANASKLQPLEAQTAQGIFASDSRTAGLPPALQKSLAMLAARRAKQQIANDMMGSGDVEYEPEDFGAALNDQINQMQRQGMFQTEGGGFMSDPSYTFKPGAQGAPKAMPKPAESPVEKMSKDPRAMAIKNNSSMSLEEKKAALAKLGY